MAATVIAAQTCSSRDPNTGLIVRLIEGQAWDADDPFVKARPQLFRFTETSSRSTVEQATKAPGEKRETRRVPKV